MIPPPTTRIEEDSLDFKKYFFLLLANWYWFILSIIISLGIAMLLNRYSMPVYQASSSLIINDESRGKGLSGYENILPGMEMYRNQKTIYNEMEILKSYSLSGRVINDLELDITYMGVGRSGFKEALLYNSSPFFVIPDSSSKNPENYPVYIDILNNSKYEVSINGYFNLKQVVAFGEKFSSGPFNFKIVLWDSVNYSARAGYSKYYFLINGNNDLINSFRERLTVNTNDEKRGSILNLSMTGNNPQQITDFLNKLMKVYIEQGLEEKNQTAINTLNFIDQQLAILDTSLQVAEMNLQDFRLKNRLIDISAEGAIAYSRFEVLQNKRASAELQTRYFKYMQEYVNNRNNLNQLVAPSTVDIFDPLLSTLTEQLNMLLAEKTELLYTVRPENPKVQILDTKIEVTREGLLDYIKNMLINNSININEIDKQLTLTEKDLDKLPETERMLISIERKYKVNDQIYTFLLQKRAESAIAKAANVSDNKILDFAIVDNAAMISPKKQSNMMIGLIFGIVFPLALLVFLDFINNKISTRVEIENKTSVPIISTIGHNSTTGDIPVFAIPKSSLAESFRGLRTNLQYMLRDKDQKVITITSTISGEGKTFCSSNLAAIFAMAGKKTLLVGLDLRRPKIHKAFNMNNSIGVSTYLIGKTGFSEIVQESKIENLFIATSGPIPPNPSELLGSPSMKTFLIEARENFEIIILDTPPFGMVTDSFLISQLSDLTLFILRQNYSSVSILSLLEEIYQKGEIGQMGLIMNDIHKKGYYGYGYRYYNYGSGYRYGYYNYANYREENG